MSVFYRADVPQGFSRPQRRENVTLEILRGRAKNPTRAVLGPTFLIGTALDCDLVLGDPQFSSVHSYLFFGKHGLSLRCLGFAPEVTVNGRTVEIALLQNRDRIRTGSYEFRVHIPSHGVDPERKTRAATMPSAEHINPVDAAAEIRALLSDIQRSTQPMTSQPASGIEQPRGGESPTAFPRLLAVEGPFPALREQRPKSTVGVLTTLCRRA